MQCACALFLSVASVSTTFFLIISYTLRFSWKGIEHEVCTFIFSTTFVWKVLILRRFERDVIKNVYWSSCKVPLFLSDFNGTWIFTAHFRKILTFQISWKSVLWSRVVPCGRTDAHDEANVRFSQFWNAPNKTKPLTKLITVVATYQ